MTRSKDSNPQHLPQKLELQARKEELGSKLTILERLHEFEFDAENPENYYSTIYLVDDKEVFGLQYGHCNVKIEPGVSTVRHELSIRPVGVQNAVAIMRNDGSVAQTAMGHYPYMSFIVLKENLDHDFFDMDGRQLASVDDFEAMADVVGAMIEISRKTVSTAKEPIDDLPEVFKNLIGKVREMPRMRFKYKKSEFYSALRRIGDKAAKVEHIDESGYERGEGVVLATTGWVRVEKDGKAFELKFDTVGQMNNGSYSDLDEVSRREEGDEGEGQYLFGETQLWPITFRPIRTAEQLQERIDMLELLDEAISDPVPASS